VTAARQLPLDLGHRPALGAEDFLVADCNRAAVAWIDAWPRWPAPALAVHGPAGCGKTHLAHVWRARGDAILLEAAALDGGEARALLGGARACALDFGAGSDGDQGAGVPALSGRAAETLFHLYNLLAEIGGHLLLTARVPPARWRLGLPDLASRLGAAPAVAIDPPDDALLAAVLVKLFADRQLEPDRRVIGYLLARMERSFAAARALAARIDRAALAAGTGPTLTLARAALAERDG